MNEALGNLNKATISREKYWEECTADEKIERLRQELSLSCRIIQRQATLIQSLMTHQHGPVGELLSPIYGQQAQAESASVGAYTADRGIPFSLRTERERR